MAHTKEGGRVLSRPEPGLAFLDFGKREMAYDACRIVDAVRTFF